MKYTLNNHRHIFKVNSNECDLCGLLKTTIEAKPQEKGIEMRHLQRQAPRSIVWREW